MNPVNRILGKGIRVDVGKNNSVKPKINWEDWIKNIEARGYTIIWHGKCPECGGKAVQIHSTGVIHSKCENNDWNQTGFGGPNVRSWAAAVAHDANIRTTEDITNERKQQIQELMMKHEAGKRYLLNK